MFSSGPNVIKPRMTLIFVVPGTKRGILLVSEGEYEEIGEDEWLSTFSANGKTVMFLDTNSEGGTSEVVIFTHRLCPLNPKNFHCNASKQSMSQVS